ncbi:MAG: cell division protein ZapE [Alphaproteobacteria bacterium]|nr:cell division protein ZapE [Alphaproteobacteria bacterium]
MTGTPLSQYNSLVKDGTLKADPVQKKAVQELERLYEEVTSQKESLVSSFFKRLKGEGGNNIKGVYLFGGVGRGKSMLMDLFFDTLPDDIKKRRVHFHEFMIEVHDYIHSRSMDESMGSGGKGMVEQALPSLADLIIRKSSILCFDEFHVTDITDAMILGRLFKILFEHGLIVVATSNWGPDDLYKDGLQRDRFLTFIELLKTKVNAVHLDSPHDYRTQTIKVEGTYFTPLNAVTEHELDNIFAKITKQAKLEKRTLRVKGRDIVTNRSAHGVARFTFSELCERPHGAEDYIEIANVFHTVFLEKIPTLGYDRRNEAKRFMNLIDALYEARTRVIISAETSPGRLYRGHDHAYEFERTVSRLLEMQSDSYP